MPTSPDQPGASAANPKYDALFREVREVCDDSNYTRATEAFNVSLKSLAEADRCTPSDANRPSLQTDFLDIMLDDVMSKFTRSVGIVNIELATNDAHMIYDFERSGAVDLELEKTRDLYLSDIAMILVNTAEAFETTPMDDDTRECRKEIAEAAVKRIYAQAVNEPIPNNAAISQLLIEFRSQLEGSLQNAASIPHTPDYLDMRMQSLDEFSNTQAALNSVITEYIEAKIRGHSGDSLPEIQLQSAVQHVVIAFKACVGLIEYEPGESLESRINSIAVLMRNIQEAQRGLVPTCVFKNDPLTIEMAHELIAIEYDNAKNDHKTTPLTDEEKAEDTVVRIAELFMRGYVNDLGQVLAHLEQTS